LKRVHRGDEGLTDIAMGRYPKDSPLVEFVGEVDELVAILGLVRAALRRHQELRPVEEALAKDQRLLMRIAGDIGMGGARKGLDPPLSNDVVEDMDREISELWKKLPPLRRFIVPGPPLEAAAVNWARAVCRRVERRAVELLRQGFLHPEVYRYLNRLSDLLFVYLRHVTMLMGANEEYL